MPNILAIVRQKLNDLMWTFISVGVIMVVLALLVVWTEVALKLFVGLAILLVAYCLFYAAYKISHVRKIID